MNQTIPCTIWELDVYDFPRDKHDLRTHRAVQISADSMPWPDDPQFYRSVKAIATGIPYHQTHIARINRALLERT